MYTWFFCGMIVLSRVAFWVYDMVDAQIFQTVSIACRVEHLLLQSPGLLVFIKWLHLIRATRLFGSVTLL